jgi:hypothetical protein
VWRVAEHRRRPRKDDALDAGVAGGDQDVERGIDVGAMRFDGILHGARHRGNRRFVEDVVHALDGAFGIRRVGQIHFQELGARLKIPAMTGDQAVGNAHGMPALQEGFDEVRSDEPRTASD